MNIDSLGFIGGGRVTGIILGGLKKAGKLPGKIIVSDQNSETLNKLKISFPDIIVSPADNKQPADCDIVFLCVPPPAIKVVVEDIKPSLKSDTILISLAPRITIAKMSEILGGSRKIVRMIPNAPSLVNSGYNPVAFSKDINSADQATLIDLFINLGKCPEVNEEKLEAYALLTAMGPTYLWFQLYNLAQLVSTLGLEENETSIAIENMVAGTVKTMLNSGLSSEKVMDLIPSKPIFEDQETIKNIYKTRLETMYAKLRP